MRFIADMDMQWKRTPDDELVSITKYHIYIHRNLAEKQP
jgi:hypothetical protein